jgi:ribosomal protein L13
MLIIWRRPKIMFKPRAIRAMIIPQTTAFKNAMDRLEITDGSSSTFFI